jgi:hypothetical protein
MSALIKFSRHVRPFVVMAFSVITLIAILLWTLDHTDIVAFVTVLFAAITLQAVVIFSLFNE